MATPMNRGSQPRPPEKGVFPLDHFNECKDGMKEYMGCLKKHGNSAQLCRELSKAYLECRMSKRLMEPEDLKKLGFDDDNTRPRAAAVKPRAEARGFLAGLPSKRAGVAKASGE